MNTIKKLSEFEFNKLNLHDFENNSRQSRYVACELSYGQNIDPILLSIDYLNILNYVNGDIYVELDKDSETYKFMENFDNAIIQLLKDTKIMKKLNITKPTLKTLILENEYDGKKYDCLRLKVQFANYFVTKIYDHNKTELTRQEFEQRLTKGNSLKSILEILSILFDTQTNTINLVSVLRQGCVKKNKPVRVPLDDFCFENSPVESESAKEVNIIQQNNGQTLLDMLKESSSSPSPVPIQQTFVVKNATETESDESETETESLSEETISVSEKSNSFQEFTKSESIQLSSSDESEVSASPVKQATKKQPAKRQPAKRMPSKRGGKK